MSLLQGPLVTSQWFAAWILYLLVSSNTYCFIRLRSVGKLTVLIVSKSQTTYTSLFDFPIVVAASRFKSVKPFQINISCYENHKIACIHSHKDPSSPVIDTQKAIIYDMSSQKEHCGTYE
jgi:hypothetical protein